jgi:hypothetical protein
LKNLEENPPLERSGRQSGRSQTSPRGGAGTESDYKLKHIQDDYKQKEDQVKMRNQEMKKLIDGALSNPESNRGYDAGPLQANSDNLLKKLAAYEDKIAD